MNILIAENDPASRTVLTKTLEAFGHCVAVAVTEQNVCERLQTQDFPLVISDWMLLNTAGLEQWRRIRDRVGAGTYVIVLTAKSACGDRLASMRVGADDFLIKPLDANELWARLNVAERVLNMQAELKSRSQRTAELAEELERQNNVLEARVRERTAELRNALHSLTGEVAQRVRSQEELLASYDATIAGWSHALDLRDKETEGHSRRVTEMSVRLAEQLGLDAEQIAQVRRGALLHDVGKLGIPDRILLKPDSLTEEEWEVMRRHPTYAHDWLATVPFLQSALDIPYSHHEKWDGSGYPLGLKGKEIPLAARLFAIVDVWDALRSNRPYRAAWPQQKVIDYIRSLSGTQFDPGIVEAFLAMVEQSAADDEEPPLALAA